MVAALAVAAAAAVSTYSVFNHTYDEPSHVLTGLEWLERGEFSLEPKHPPLGRVAVALGPWLAGARWPDEPYVGESSLYRNGNRILYGGEYHRTLGLARLGALPFLLGALLVAWAWARGA